MELYELCGRDVKTNKTKTKKKKKKQCLFYFIIKAIRTPVVGLIKPWRYVVALERTGSEGPRAFYWSFWRNNREKVNPRNRAVLIYGGTP